MDDCSFYTTKRKRARSYRKSKEKETSLMYSVLLKNYWLERVERRRKEQIKQTRINGIINSIKPKLPKDKKKQ